MSSIFDRLQKKLELEKKDQGISPLEIANLPANLRKLMRLMTREVQIFYVDLQKKIADMPERDRLSQTDLDQALTELTRAGWLIKRGEAERVSYQVNFRRKSGSKLAQGIWGSLDAKIAASKEAHQSTDKPPADEPAE